MLCSRPIRRLSARAHTPQADFAFTRPTKTVIVRVTFALFAGLLIVGAAGSSGAEPQPGITSIVASAAQLGEGWTSNRVMVLIDPLSSPKEIADPHENGEGLLRMARDLLTKEPRREAYAMLRYYGGGSGSRQTNSLVYITRWKSKRDIGDDWGRDKETKDSPGALPKVGEEVHFYQRDGLHNDITFRRGKYLICVECPTSYGVEHLKRLAEVLDSNLLKAQKALATGGQGPARQ